MRLLPPKRYHAIVFHPGPKSHWRTARKFLRSAPNEVPTEVGQIEPDPAEVIVDRMFRTEVIAVAWARMHLRQLRNVLAEIHDTSQLDR